MTVPMRQARLATFTLALAIAGSVVAPMRAAPELRPVTAPEVLSAALLRQAPTLDPHVLALALQSHDNAAARGLLADPTTLTVIDYSRPSVDPRFWVFDLAARKLLFEERVAHGKNSGDLLATRFSNSEASLESSLGLFVTGDVYTGKHGESLRLAGLEPGFNDRALARAIVIHGADYVGPAAIAKLGFVGRSWGCPALPADVAPRVIERVRGGSALFAYYPDARWLKSSAFLQPATIAVGPAAPSTHPA